MLAVGGVTGTVLYCTVLYCTVLYCTVMDVVMDVCAGSRRSGGDGNMLVMAPDNVVIDCICLVSALNTLSHTTN